MTKKLSLPLLCLLLALSLPALAVHTGASNDNDDPSVEPVPQQPDSSSPRLRDIRRTKEKVRNNSSAPAGDVSNQPSVDVKPSSDSDETGDATAAHPTAESVSEANKELSDFITMGTSPETGKVSDTDKAPIGPFTVGGKFMYGLAADDGLKVGPDANLDKLAQQSKADVSVSQNGDPRGFNQADLQQMAAGMAMQMAMQMMINGQAVGSDPAITGGGCAGGC